MDVAVLTLLVLVAGLAVFVWWLRVLVEVVRTPAPAWRAAGQSQLVHVLLLIFLGVIGAIVYVVVARPQLRQVGAR